VSAEPEEQRALLEAKVVLLEEFKEYMNQHKREFVGKADWYPWQHEEFETKATQTMLMAANRSGKTMSAGFHTALDLTCQYPDWWTGYRYTHAPNVLVAGVDNEQLKLVVQTELFGDIFENYKGKKQFMGGWVHRDEIGRVEWSQIPGLAKRVEVINKYGRASCMLRAYTHSKTGQGSLSFAGFSLDLAWADECPPDDIVGQLIARIMTGNLNKGGHIRYTMTPELGATNLVTNFMENRSEHQHLIGPISWKECPHLSPELQEATLAGIPEHERDMRSKGIPFFGEGLIYTVPDSRITFEPFKIERVPWMKFIRAIDLGISHPTAIAWLGYDSEHDTIYVLRTYSQAGDAAAIHAAAANSFLPFAPIVFPHDVDQREKGSGKTVRQYYAEAGLKNSLDFKNPDGTIHVEPGIMEITDRMRSGRFKVFDDCKGFFREKRLYHREKGQIKKTNDDIMDAVRYGAMMIQRYGVPLGGHKKRPQKKKRFSWSK